MRYTTHCCWNENDSMTVQSIDGHVVFRTADEDGMATSVVLTNDMLSELSREISSYLNSLNNTVTTRTKKTPPAYTALTDQAKLVFRHMDRAGSISAREAMNDYGITSATLARRICDIEAEGFQIRRERRIHPITGKRYTRYYLIDAGNRN